MFEIKLLMNVLTFHMQFYPHYHTIRAVFMAPWICTADNYIEVRAQFVFLIHVKCIFIKDTILNS